MTVHLPAAVDWSQLTLATYGYQAKMTQLDPQTVVFTAGSVPDSTEMEVRVQFPHGIVTAQPPAWQARDDERVELELGQSSREALAPQAVIHGSASSARW